MEACLGSRSVNPVQVNGYVDTSTFAVGFRITTLGITLGDYFDDLKENVTVNVALAQATGLIVFYLKNGNEVCVQTDVKVTFNSSYTQDSKLVGF
ncbi:hypothetical protein MMC06_003759 [Schaereria dolodes]|nr:hypothetical protein [Schaereria dolodes]